MQIACLDHVVADGCNMPSLCTNQSQSGAYMPQLCACSASVQTYHLTPPCRSVSALDLYANGPVRSIPTLIIGAGRNRDCVPPFANYQQFFKVMPGPTWLVVIQQAGHLQFLDQMTTLQQAVCSVGKVGLGEVPAATAVLVTSWLDAVGVQMLPTAVHGVDPKDTGSTSGSEQRQVRTLDAVSADDVQQAMVAVVQEVLKVHPDLQLSIDAQL
jgi:hypothetical protein